MANFNRLVNEVIGQADVLLLVVDARRLKESINTELEDKLKKSGKKYIYVINKVDLLSKEEQDRISLPFSVQVSAMNHLGTMRLHRKIMELAKGERVTVGVIGYPNVGKSTVINALKGQHSAPTSSSSGFTKGIQKVRVSEKVTLIDTPGVFSYENKEDINMVVIGAIDAEKLKDPTNTALKVIQALNGKIEKYYGVPVSEDFVQTLETIAMQEHIIKKGNQPDTARMGKMIINLYQNGKIR